MPETDIYSLFCVPETDIYTMFCVPETDIYTMFLIQATSKPSMPWEGPSLGHKICSSVVSEGANVEVSAWGASHGRDAHGTTTSAGGALDVLCVYECVCVFKCVCV